MLDVDFDVLFDDVRNQPDRDITQLTDSGTTGVDAADIRLTGERTSQPCDDDEICRSGFCLQEPLFTDGYCTTMDCGSLRNCPLPGDVCIEDRGLSFCAPPCERTLDCRIGLVCRGEGEQVCLPPIPPEGFPDGERCAADTECTGGTCLPDPGFPNGYCTTLACQFGSDCANTGVTNFCEFLQDERRCMRSCDTADDCREGYSCVLGRTGRTRCTPSQAGSDVPDVPNPEPVVPDAGPFALTCVDVEAAGGTAVIPFTIPEGTTAWMFGAYTDDRYIVSPTSLTTPATTLSLRSGESSLLSVTSALLGSIIAIQMPQFPSLQPFVVAGDHTLTVETSSDELCWYLVTESSPAAPTGPARLDLNVYLVGVDELTAATAPASTELQYVFDLVDGIFEQAGVQLGLIRYFDVSEEIADRYAIIRDYDDAQDLALTSVVPGTGNANEALSLNVFITNSFNFRGAEGVIGISMGIPGTAGLHGTIASGVAMTSRYLFASDGDRTIASVLLAHELGHYLGLFHTTEVSGGASDPLTDTPNCIGSAFPDACPDRTNLMFPLAYGTNRSLSAQQGATLISNPLTRYP